MAASFSARGKGAPAGLGQGARHGLVAARLGVEQVHGDRLRRGARLREHPGRVGVPPSALSRREPAQNGLSHQRMLELERPGVAQDAGAHQPLAILRRLLRIDADQPCGRDQRCGLEHGYRVSEPRRPVAQTRERCADRLRDHVRPEPGHSLGVVDPALQEPIG